MKGAFQTLLYYYFGKKIHFWRNESNWKVWGRKMFTGSFSSGSESCFMDWFMCHMLSSRLEAPDWENRKQVWLLIVNTCVQVQVYKVQQSSVQQKPLNTELWWFQSGADSREDSPQGCFNSFDVTWSSLWVFILWFRLVLRSPHKNVWCLSKWNVLMRCSTTSLHQSFRANISSSHRRKNIDGSHKMTQTGFRVLVLMHISPPSHKFPSNCSFNFNQMKMQMKQSVAVNSAVGALNPADDTRWTEKSPVEAQTMENLKEIRHFCQLHVLMWGRFHPPHRSPHRSDVFVGLYSCILNQLKATRMRNSTQNNYLLAFKIKSFELLYNKFLFYNR